MEYNGGLRPVTIPRTDTWNATTDGVVHMPELVFRFQIDIPFYVSSFCFQLPEISTLPLSNNPFTAPSGTTIARRFCKP